VKHNNLKEIMPCFVGRRPYTDGLNADAGAVPDRGQVEVNDHLQPMFLHHLWLLVISACDKRLHIKLKKGYVEAMNNAGQNTHIDYNLIPA
jgi:pyruvate/2-oxoglutarate dehydrogenase complex dihydrolipoamide dehydrogenase (E3) component